MAGFLLPVGLGLAGMLSGSAKEKAARRAERHNQQMSANDTMFSGLIGGKGYQRAVPDAGPGAIGGALSGALSGFNQAQAFDKAKLDEELLRSKIKGSEIYNQIGARIAGAMPAVGQGQSRYNDVLSKDMDLSYLGPIRRP